MKCALAFIPALAIGLSCPASGGEKPARLAQSQVSASCMASCNTQYLTCANQCPVSGAVSQNQPDINAGQVIQQNRVDILRNAQPIQCRLNCTSQQQSCWATCR